MSKGMGISSMLLSLLLVAAVPAVGQSANIAAPTRKESAPKPGVRQGAGSKASGKSAKAKSVPEEFEPFYEDDELGGDAPPEFPGGRAAMHRFIAANIRYPQEAQDNDIQGVVYLTFTVEGDGTVTGIEVLRDIGGGCGAEAVRVIESMPPWTPGRKRGRAVRMRHNLSIGFTLKPE